MYGRGHSCTAVPDLVDAERTRSMLPSATDLKAARGRRQHKRARLPRQARRHGLRAEAVSALGQRPDGEHSSAIGELAEFGQGQVGGEPRHQEAGVAAQVDQRGVSTVVARMLSMNVTTANANSASGPALPQVGVVWGGDAPLIWAAPLS